MSPGSIGVNFDFRPLVTFWILVCCQPAIDMLCRLKIWIDFAVFSGFKVLSLNIIFNLIDGVFIKRTMVMYGCG